MENPSSAFIRTPDTRSAREAIDAGWAILSSGDSDADCIALSDSDILDIELAQ